MVADHCREIVQMVDGMLPCLDILPDKYACFHCTQNEMSALNCSVSLRFGI